MKNLKLIASLRILFGLLALSAIATQFASTLANGRNVVDFFSFFTIESNLLAIILLLSMGIYGLLGKTGKSIAFFRGAVTLFMTMTGIIYILLLSGNEISLQTTIPWVNIVLHYLMPAVILLDWLIFPPRQRVTFSQALAWLLFPLAYFVYSIIRGGFTGWYPYPFINPIVNGWPNVIGMSLAIALGITLLAGLLSLRTVRQKAPAKQ